MQKITKAVIPAAGLGSRMEPLSNYLPKPMLPLGKKPVLQYIIEELKLAGIHEIGIIIRREYRSVVDYFSGDSSLTFIYDDTVSGPGGALLKAESFVNGSDFVVVFSDAPMKKEGQSDYLRKLIEIKEQKKSEVVLSIYQIPQLEISSRGIVVFEEEYLSEGRTIQLQDIIEKPSTNQEVGRWASACRYVLSPKIFDVLRNVSRDDNGELQLTPAIQYYINEGDLVLGYPLPKNVTRYDTGNFEGYFKAFQDFTSGA